MLDPGSRLGEWLTHLQQHQFDLVAERTLEAAGGALQQRQFAHARRAPRTPEAEQDDATPQLRE